MSRLSVGSRQLSVAAPTSTIPCVMEAATSKTKSPIATPTTRFSDALLLEKIPKGRFWIGKSALARFADSTQLLSFGSWVAYTPQSINLEPPIPPAQRRVVRDDSADVAFSKSLDRDVFISASKNQRCGQKKVDIAVHRRGLAPELVGKP